MIGANFAGKILYRLYAIRNRRIRKFVMYLVEKIEFTKIRAEIVPCLPYKPKNLRYFQPHYLHMWSRLIRRIYADYHDIEIGMYSYGSCFDIRNIEPRTKIGRYCSFARDVRIINENHPIKFKSSHPLFHFPALGYAKKDAVVRSNINIGNDVWFGKSSLVLPRVRRIGDGAVIGAGAVVTRDVPDFAIVAGNPAKVIRYRFSNETIRKLKVEKWWEKDIEDLQMDVNSFLTPLDEKVTY